jgi:hypothetical protein
MLWPAIHSETKTIMTMRSPSFFTLRSVALACGLALGVAAVQAAPDAKLLAAAEKAQPAVIDNLKEMVLIESGSLNVDGLMKMADVVEGRLKAAGFKTERRKASAGAGADIVIGTLKGTGKRKIMLQGHMDTVYAPGILNSQPYKVDGNRIYGPGIADDKGGLAVMMASLKILADAGWRDYDTLTVLMNPDEEVGSVGSGELIATTADLHDTVLSFEPTAAKSVAKGESLLLGAAGIAQATMEVKGRAAHAGAAPELGRNALYELSYQMLQTKDLAKDIPGVTLNWTVARATGPINQITEKAPGAGRHPHHAARRREETQRRASGEDCQRQADSRHRDHGQGRGGPPGLHRGREGPRAGPEGPGHLQGNRPRPRADAHDRRRHRRGLRGPLGQGHGGRELRPRGLRLSRTRRVHRSRLDRAAYLPRHTPADRDRQELIVTRSKSLPARGA